ncbi:hypothetical protein CU098_011753 [Rhizopus stolonifer]|uniref:Uncharacterized protein n=1 Tax=Rhizopus stolonifer TaxID=4846 RepID=A0A367KY23_RHIST|nr:hypothetical protein CU098_011753 [Rhizopus stolonifer]
MTSCVILGHFAYSSPFCMYSTSATLNYFCLEDMNVLIFKNQLNTKAHYLKQLFKTNPHHFLKSNDGRTFVLTRTMIHIARSFNCFHIAELCKLTAEDILARVADPLLKCIEYDPWIMAIPSRYIMSKHSNLELKRLDGNEWFLNSSGSFIPRILAEKQYTVKKSIKEKGHLYPICLHRWLLTDMSDYQLDSSIFQTFKSVEKTKVQQQAIIKTRQHLSKQPLSPPVYCSSNAKRRKGAYLHYKKPRLQERVPVNNATPTTTSDHNLHLLASQATQIRTSSLLQTIDQQPRQPLRLPSIQSMLSPMTNMDSCA